MNQIMRTPKRNLTHTPIPVQDSPDKPKPLQQGLIVAGRFKLIEKVGQGSFGSIFKTENTETGEICATKFEKRDNGKNISLLVREIKVLLELKGLLGFPQIYYYGRDDQHNYFMITYLGYNLEHLLRKTKSFSQLTCLKLSLQIIDKLEQLHNKNLLHRDLKPENIVIGWHDIDVLYLIDFGLSKYYKDPNGVHIPMAEKKGIIGTARYASISAHLGREQSRKDDLESLAYVLIYLYKGKLPWMNIQIKDKLLKYQKILEQKQTIPHEKLCENLPKCYYTLLQHSKSREFQEPPNYAYLKDQFQKTITEIEQSEPFQGFDWERLPELKSKKQKLIRNNSKAHKSPDKVPQLFQQKSAIANYEKPVERKSQVSFLNVPEIGMDNSPDKQNDNKRSRGYQSHNSNGTTKMINYQISHLGGVEGDNYRKYLQQISVKRRDSKSFTVTNLNAQQEVKRSSFFKEATNKENVMKQQTEVDEEYFQFDDLDLIADDETKISFQNIQIRSKKPDMYHS